MDSRRDKLLRLSCKNKKKAMNNSSFWSLLYILVFRGKQLVHTSSLSGAAKVNEILEGRESCSRVEFQMEPEILRSILDYLKREHLLEGTSLVAVEEQLVMFMHMVSHKASNQDL